MVQELGQTSEFSGLIQDGIKLFQFRLLPEKDAPWLLAAKLTSFYASCATDALSHGWTQNSIALLTIMEDETDQSVKRTGLEGYVSLP